MHSRFQDELTLYFSEGQMNNHIASVSLKSWIDMINICDKFKIPFSLSVLAYFLLRN